MLIPLKLIWTSTGTFGDRDYDQSYGETFAASRSDFDTVTRVPVRVPFPLGGDYTYDQGSGSTMDPPQDYSRPTTEEFFVYVNGPNRLGYFHDGNGGVTTVSTTLVLTSQVVGCTCYGDSSGDILVQTSGMDGPFTYLWEDGATTLNRSLVKAGTYRLAVTDVPSGAIARATILVGSNPELVVVIEKAGGDVTLQVSGGTGVYTYLWDDGSTSRTRTDLPSGPHSCVITDILGCTKEVQPGGQPRPVFLVAQPHHPGPGRRQRLPPGSHHQAPPLVFVRGLD
ncbi:SprB repeat-containing protein [Hymenobacter humi]|uniref:SprB repeat-containing protein n=1 Tax=Hymenobacter humi TaxID=1411620 RepID=A0ABW2U8R5_9BACT